VRKGVTIAEDVLELARWSPSGDNSQPWRFTLRSASEFDVHGYDTSAHCVYDLDRWASELSHGMLLETIAIAATRHGSRAHISLPERIDSSPLRYRVALQGDSSITEDPRADAIIRRTVQRRPMRWRRLSTDERSALERAAAPFRLASFETWGARRRVAALYARNARIRMTIPEAYAVHRSVIAWHTTTSEDRMPDASLGAGPVLLAIMRRAMVSWARIDRLNRWTGTLMPRIALDFFPGIFCSAQIALIADREPASLADRIAAGRPAQRLWLTAATLGLQMQPQYTPLVFARYAREGRPFTTDARARGEALGVATQLEAMLGEGAAKRAVWLARIGPARPVAGRSLRLPLSTLIVAAPPSELPPVTARHHNVVTERGIG
jgi:nitroreductase